MAASMTREGALTRLKEAKKGLAQFGDKFFNLVAVLGIDAPFAISLGGDLQKNVRQILDGMAVVKKHIETMKH